MKKILLLGTGGTIASADAGDGLTPGMDGADFLRYVPAIQDLCQVDCLQVCNIDSTNMTPRRWMQLAQAVEKHYDAYDGFVISHGTDTMAYTAAALSCLIQGSYGAFSSINYPVLGVVQEGRLLPYLCPQAETQLAFYHDLETNVSLVKLIPGLSPDYLAFALEHSRGVLIESFGVGGVPDGEAGGYYDLIRRAEAQGKTVVLTTQVQNEGSDLGIYQVGHSLKADLGVMETYDMTLEMAVAKLMWALAQTKDPAEVTRYFYTPVANEILRVPGESL